MQSGSYQLKVCLDSSGNRNRGDHNDNLDENGVDNGDVICSEQYPLTIEGALFDNFVTDLNWIPSGLNFYQSSEGKYAL